MNRRTHAHGLCGPDCGYRPLYEGSQASLSDMANKQATALTRVSRLRQGIIQELKQAFPVEFADAERQLGKRMNGLDDEVLIAYLSGFLAMPKAQTAIRQSYGSGAKAPAEVGELRTALAKLGIVVPANTDFTTWAAAIENWGNKHTPAPVTVIPPTQAGKAPTVEVSQARLEAGGEDPASPASGFPAPTGQPLQIFDDWPGEQSYVEDARPSDDEAAWAGLLAEDVDSGWAEVEENPLFSQGPGQVTDREPEPAAPLDLNALFGDDDTSAEPLPQYAPPVHNTPFGVVPQEPETNEPVQQPVPFGIYDQVEPEPEPVKKTPASKPPKPRVGSQQAAQNEDGPTQVTTRNSEPIKPIATAATPVGNQAIGTGGTKRKPAAKTPGKPGRKPRVSAAGPELNNVEAELVAAAGNSGGEVTEELKNKFLAVAAMARPVFISDLVDIIGDSELVGKIEREFRAMGAAGPLRFINPKQRHKQRGALILPFAEELKEASVGFEKSLWARCVNTNHLKGAKLYELAVVLHRLLEQVVTLDIGTNVVTLRVNQPRGLVGVLVVLDAEVEKGSTTRQELGEAVAALASGRLGLLAVCTYAGGPKSVPEVAQAARDEIQQRGLEPDCPVIAQNSWSFASDGGTSAISVL